MASGPRYSVKFRRRREGKTDYKGRLALLKGKVTRIVVRKSNRAIRIQFIDFKNDGDRILGSANSNELKALGWKHSTKSIPASYLTGLLASKKVFGSVKTAILDMGQNRPRRGSKVFAALLGAVDGGLDIPFGKEILPSYDRVRGAHIESYRKVPITNDFDKMKETIMNLEPGKLEKKAKKPRKAPTPKPKAAPTPKPKEISTPKAEPVKKPAPQIEEAKPEPSHKTKIDDLDDLLKDLSGESSSADEKNQTDAKPKSALEELLKKRREKKE